MFVSCNGQITVNTIASTITLLKTLLTIRITILLKYVNSIKLYQNIYMAITLSEHLIIFQNLTRCTTLATVIVKVIYPNS